MDLDRPMERAVDAADFFLSQAVDRIDRRFGKGFSGNHPELAAAFVQAAAACMNTAGLIESHLNAASAIASAVDGR